MESSNKKKEAGSGSGQDDSVTEDPFSEGAAASKQSEPVYKKSLYTRRHKRGCY
jgi:hypothetical protein